MACVEAPRAVSSTARPTRPPCEGPAAPRGRPRRRRGYKAGRLDSGTLHQALYYASSLARLSADELCAKLEPGPEGVRRRRDAVGAGETASRLRSGRWGARGRARARWRRCHRRPRAHIDRRSSASRCSSWLGGRRLLIREVSEEHADAPSRPCPERSVEAIRQRAAAETVLEPFGRFIGMSEDAGLFVRPYTLSVMITPPGHHGRFLMYATPRAAASTSAPGRMRSRSSSTVSEQGAVDALDPGNVDQFLTRPEARPRRRRRVQTADRSRAATDEPPDVGRLVGPVGRAAQR